MVDVNDVRHHMVTEALYCALMDAIRSGRSMDARVFSELFRQYEVEHGN